MKVIAPQQIDVLLADREFIGQAWFTFLSDQNIPFAIRIRENSLADEWFRLAHFFTHLEDWKTKNLHHRYKICGCDLAVAATRSCDKQLVIIVSNRKPSWALKIYTLRWQIESLFKALKSSGFKLEDTHLTSTDKLTTLVAIVSLAFLWAMKVGDWLHQQQPIRLKSHGRREKSLFRLGFDFIRRAVTNFSLDKKLLLDTFSLLSCT